MTKFSVFLDQRPGSVSVARIRKLLDAPAKNRLNRLEPQEKRKRAAFGSLRRDHDEFAASDTFFDMGKLLRNRFRSMHEPYMEHCYRATVMMDCERVRWRAEGETIRFPLRPDW